MKKLVVCSWVCLLLSMGVLSYLGGTKEVSHANLNNPIFKSVMSRLTANEMPSK